MSDNKNKMIIGILIGVVITLFTVLIILFSEYKSVTEPPVPGTDCPPTTVENTETTIADTTTVAAQPEESDEDIIIKNAHPNYIRTYPSRLTCTKGIVNITNANAGNQLNIIDGRLKPTKRLAQIDNGSEIYILYLEPNDDGETYSYIYDPNQDIYGWVLTKYIEKYEW